MFEGEITKESLTSHHFHSVLATHTHTYSKATNNSLSFFLHRRQEVELVLLCILRDEEGADPSPRLWKGEEAVHFDESVGLLDCHLGIRQTWEEAVDHGMGVMVGVVALVPPPPEGVWQ